MVFLHLSDFHYNGDRRVLDRVIPSIIKCIKDSNKSIDYILFTGDLVFSGSIKKHFEEARKELFDFLSKELSVTKDRIIFCPGNHDIDYGQIRYSYDSFFKTKITNNHELNLLYNGKHEDKFVFPDSLCPLSNYVDFLKSYHSDDNNNIIRELYSIHYRLYGDQKIAFVCLFTPWLSNLDNTGGKNDYGNLYIPEALFDKLQDDLSKDISRKIMLIHHPISFLRDFNAYEIENQIYDNFDMLFAGHIHKMANITRHNGVNGIYEHSAKASLSNKELLGCTLIENDDYEDNIFTVSEITYIKDSNESHMGTPFVVTVPIGSEKEERNKLRKKIYEKVDLERDNANNLLLLKQEDGGQDFLNSFSTPLIKRSKDDSMSKTSSALLSMSELYSTNEHLIILGKDKCGKTSLLRRIQLEYLMNYTTYNRVPIFLDAKEEENRVDDTYSINDIPRSYLGLNRKLSEQLINSDQLVLLIDNYKPSTAFSNYLDLFLKQHPNAILIAVGEDNISAGYDYRNLKFGDQLGVTILYFNDLRKKEIIKYTDLQLANETNKTQIQEKILKLCKQMELPYNYWTISLFLLIHQKASDTYSKNLFSILDVCVDEIFGKKKLLLSKSTVTFNQLKSICAMLATYLFETHESEIYSATKDEIIDFLKREFAKKKRVAITAEEAFNFFVSCAILKTRSNGYFVFRLNGFFEYFLAYQMTQNEEFKSSILSDEKRYLAFKNQLEIYSGLRNSDSDFLKLVFEKTVSKCKPLFSQYSSFKDKELIHKIEISNQLKDDMRLISINKAMNAVQKAEIEERIDGDFELNSEVHLIKDIDPDEQSSDVVGRYLSILTRVFKNIDEVSDPNIDTEQMFRTILDYYCDFSYFFIEELTEKTKERINQEIFDNEDEERAFNLLKLMSNFSPLVIQMEFFDGLGHFSLERMAKDEICKLKEDASNNQYKLFVLYFFLFDLTLDGRESLMNEAISLIQMPLLRYMMLLKFNYYLAFRSESNQSLQTILSEKIRKTRRLLNNKTDKNVIELGISEMKKDSIVNRHL